MATITSKCPYCGAQIVFNDDDKLVVCKYCSSAIEIKSNGTSNFTLKKVALAFEFLGYYFESPESTYTTGTLELTEDDIILRPSRLLNRNLSEVTINIHDICGYAKCRDSVTLLGLILGFDTGIILSIKEGEEIKKIRFEIGLGNRSDRDNLLNNIEYFRKQYFTKRNQKVPELAEDSIKVYGRRLVSMRLSIPGIITPLFKRLLIV